MHPPKQPLSGIIFLTQFSCLIQTSFKQIISILKISSVILVKLYCFTLRLNLQTDLYKEWNGVESSDDYSVVDISGQDVKCSCTPFHNLLHTYSLLINKQRKISALAASLSTDFLVDRVVLRTTALSVNSRHHGLVFIKAV